MRRTIRTIAVLSAVSALAACNQDVTSPAADIAGTAARRVSVDVGTGEGFVGKGDVQLAFGWNNRALQDNAGSGKFQPNPETVTEVSWVCTNSNNDNIQQRERTTTESVTGLMANGVRERNQFTGFLLTGFDGQTKTDTTTEGNQLNSCPSSSLWSLTTPAGDPVVVSTRGGLQVSINGTDWFDIATP
jgi:hypothetical protein